MKRIAVIVIGSNSTRMLSADASRDLTNPLRGRVETRLFLGMNKQGVFDGQAIAYTAESVNRLKEQAEADNAELTGIYATSAARDAANTDLLSREIFALTGHSLTILTGKEEAAYSFFGAGAGETCGVIDIGGGSTEIVFGSGMDISAAHSYQLGASRLFKTHPVNSPADCIQAIEAAKSLLADLPKRFENHLRTSSFYLIGGTGTSCARIMGKPPEGCRLTRDQVADLLYLLAETPRDERANIKGFPPSRIDILPTGIVILHAIMKVLDVPSVVVTERTNADGLLREFVHKKFS